MTPEPDGFDAPALSHTRAFLAAGRGQDGDAAGTANDSAVSVYAVFPHSPVSVKSLKYTWSAVVPVGTRLSSSGGLTQVLVIRSGTEKKSAWTEESVNVLENYKKFFDESETPKASGIAVLTDSDDTKSVAQGDYANFRLCKP